MSGDAGAREPAVEREAARGQPCEVCGTIFRRTIHKQVRFTCSLACSRERRTGRKLARHGDIGAFLDAYTIPEPNSGCWLWDGPVDKKGYGRTTPMSGRSVLMHRLSYQHHRKPIPPGLVIDHLCRNPRCINPDHLEVVTFGENIRRGTAPSKARERGRAQTHCKHGHPYLPDNVYVSATGGRSCRICRNDVARRARLRKRLHG